MDFTTAFHADFETGKLYWKSPPKEHAEKLGMEAGYICKGKNGNLDYWQIRLGGKTYKRSRVIFFMAHGRWPTPQVDHANRDSLDDRLSNLRECSPSDNARNRSPNKKSVLPMGVSTTKQGKFMARIKSRSLGVFETPLLAAEAYQKARKEHFGEYA